MLVEVEDGIGKFFTPSDVVGSVCRTLIMAHHLDIGGGILGEW